MDKYDEKENIFIEGKCLVTKKDKYGNIIEQYYEDSIQKISKQKRWETIDYEQPGKSLAVGNHLYRCIDEGEGIWEVTR